ncbi:MAG: septal ring lytic transglycosylase RlpA family protein [Acidobacteriota bacterium]
MSRILCLALLFALLSTGCGKKKIKAHVPAAPVGATERGVASWYGVPYHGRQAADGEIYDMETMVAAHRTLSFQTWVRVRNLTNDKTVDVRIIDRGPFVDGRIIDLSHAAARQIELIGPGVARVELTVISAPPAPPSAFFAVQVGVYRERANADRMERNMIAAYGAAKTLPRPESPGVWRVLAGRETSIESAESLARRIREEQRVPEAFVVRLDP